MDHIDAGACGEDDTLATIASIRKATGETIDPHTAVAVHVARRAKSQGPIVVASTAHPAKFPDAVEKATGVRPRLPGFLADLYDRPERATDMPNDVAKLKEFVAARVGAK